MSDALPSLGQRLKAERERRGMSMQKAADDLRLDAWVIEALEAGDYARIGPTVYAKGYLKKYASILGIPANEVIAGTEPAPAIPPAPVMRVTNAPAAPATANAGLLAAAVAFVLVASAAAILWWHPWRTSAKGSPTAALAPRAAGARGPGTGAIATVGEAGAGASVAAGATPASGGGDVSVSGASAQDAAKGTVVGTDAARGAEGAPPEGMPSGAGGGPGREAGAGLAAGASLAAGAGAAGEGAVVPHLGRGMARAAEARGALVAARRGEKTPGAPARTATVEAGGAPGTAGAAGSVRGAGHARLRLSFSADSWVEVRDAAGRRVFAGQGRANSVQTVAGTAPLRVYLGYASGVQLEVNDRAVAIGRQFVTGDVARFEAGADGVLRRDSSNATPVAGAASPRG